MVKIKNEDKKGSKKGIETDENKKVDVAPAPVDEVVEVESVLHSDKKSINRKRVSKGNIPKSMTKKGSEIIGGRYMKVNTLKCIVSDTSGQNKESFSGITPQKVTLKGKDGVYFDLKSRTHTDYAGRVGEEVDLNQYIYNALHSSTRPAQKRVATSKGSYTDQVVERRNWSIEIVE